MRKLHRLGDTQQLLSHFRMQRFLISSSLRATVVVIIICRPKLRNEIHDRIRDHTSKAPFAMVMIMTSPH